MARLMNVGGEEGSTYTAGSIGGTGTITYDAASARIAGTGKSVKFDTGATSTSTAYVDVGFTLLNITALNGTDYFMRVYMKISGNPTGAIVVMGLRSAVYEVKLSSSGTLQMFASGASVGSESSALTANQWYRVEFRVRPTASASACQMELLLDGVQVAVSTTVNVIALPNIFRIGLTGSTGVSNFVLTTDDMALNDSSGSTQNSWPGDSALTLLLPVSNNSVGNWKNGTGTSAVNDGNQWQALDNTPPTPSSASPIATGQAISNAVSGASNAGIGDFNLATYSSAGLDANDTINFVQMMIVHGEDASTGIKTGTFNVQSNPTQSVANNVAAGGSSQFGPSAGGAVGAWSTNWAFTLGTQQDSPSVTLGTNPVGRINKTDTGTRGADLAFMGLWVDFTPSAAAIFTKNTFVQQAVNRSASY